MITFEDAETGEQIEINTSSRAVRLAFAAAESSRRKAVDKLFGMRGMDVVPLATNEGYLLPLRAFFERRERGWPHDAQPAQRATPVPIHDITGPVSFLSLPLWMIIAGAIAFLILARFCGLAHSSPTRPQADP